MHRTATELLQKTRRGLERLVFSTPMVFTLAACGVGAIAAGVWKAMTPVDQDRVVASSAMVALSQMSESLRTDIGNIVKPQIERTEKLARDPDVIASLRTPDSTRQTDICNRAVTHATEIDAFALFDKTGRIAAINTVYATGKPIPQERVNRILHLDFDKRDIIQKCVRNAAQSNVLEFQTTCDITPAFFDSSGLSVAYSVPVTDPVTGEKLGVVSSRVRFDRLTDLIRAHAIAGKAGSAEFVTDKGGYFSEQINTGKTPPPVPTSVLAGIVSPMVSGKVDAVFCRNGADYLSLVRVKNFQTLENGGIQVMLVVKGEWLATEARQAKQLACGMWVAGGLTLILGAGTVRGIMTVHVSEQWNRLVLGGTLAAVVVTDEQGVIQDWNRRAEKVFGYSAAEARGRRLSDLVFPAGFDRKDSGCVLPGTSATAATTVQGAGELRLVRKDGAPVTAQMAVTAMRLGKHSRHCVFLYDITEYKQTQAQLAQAQKLESIGQLAAGIAHEINTPAQYVGDNIRFLKEQLGGLMAVIDEYALQIDPNQPPLTWSRRHERVTQTLRALDFEFLKDEIPKAIDQSIEGLDRVTAIVKAMKDFSHPGSDHKEAADLNRSIASTIEVCRNRWKFVADLTTDFAPNLPHVPCLIAEFNQVVLNLIVNAADAIGENGASGGASGGHIHVSTAVIAAAAGPAVEVRIRDNGPGIPESVRARMFEPFFTTKPVGKGTGQGLTISRNVIVAKHGGELFFESNADGPGTTFVIRLPIEDALAEDLADVESDTKLQEAA